MQDLPKNQNGPYKIILGVFGSVLVIGLSFYGGVAYQKNHTAKVTAQTSTAAGVAGRFGTGRGGFRNGVFGSVTAISSTSITVQDTRTNTAKTLSISSATVITDNGTTVTTDDIKVGDSVVVTADTTTTTLAARILVNPSQGGFGGGAPDGSSQQTQ